MNSHLQAIRPTVAHAIGLKRTEARSGCLICLSNFIGTANVGWVSVRRNLRVRVTVRLVPLWQEASLWKRNAKNSSSAGDETTSRLFMYINSDPQKQSEAGCTISTVLRTLNMHSTKILVQFAMAVTYSCSQFLALSF